ncbi:YdeI/OmpD-associated family protein [Caproicibacter sp.]|uniref:YdeI/OmpD-associated family protein n=1 Tax=Caproicibacter sp. TaxID=2814884 RepID=UPI00398A1DB9
MGKKNPDATDMPIGLMMSLAQHTNAMKTFGRLDDEQQKSVIRYVEDSTTGEEAKSRIQNAVQNLDQGDTGFIG